MIEAIAVQFSVFDRDNMRMCDASCSFENMQAFRNETNAEINGVVFKDGDNFFTSYGKSWTIYNSEKNALEIVRVGAGANGDSTVWEK